MTFTDDDLKRLKDRFIDDPRSYRAKTMVVSLKGIQALLARLEAAEKVIDKSGCGCCADYDELKEAKEVWRKARGAGK